MIACAARKCTSVEQSYASCKGELRAVLYGLNKFENMIAMSSFFFLITDAMSLKWLVTMKTSSKLFLRWSTEIFSYNFKILHRKGKIHLNADVLSRDVSILDEPSQNDVDENRIHSMFSHKLCKLQNCRICVEYPNQLYSRSSQARIDMGKLLTESKIEVLEKLSVKEIKAMAHVNEQFANTVSNEQFADAQKLDRVLSEVMTWLVKGVPENLQLYDSEILYFVEHFSLISLKNDVLHIKLSEKTDHDIIFGESLKKLVPLSLQKEIIASGHASKHSGHFKLKSTLHRVASKFHWRTIKSDIASFISQCVICNVTTDKIPEKHSIYSNMECNVLNSCVHFDLSGPWQKDNKNFVYVLVLVEACTRYTIFVPIKDKRAQTVAEAIITKYIGYFGIPNHFFSDLGTENFNQLNRTLCQALEIEHNFCPIDKHSSNLAERTIKELVRFFRILSEEEKRKWSIFLPMFQIGQNAHFNTTLGMSSFEALTGRKIPISIEVALGSSNLETNTDKNSQKNSVSGPNPFLIKDVFNRIMKEMFQSKSKSIRIRSHEYSNRSRTFNVGDLVWLFVQASRKIRLNWHGPFRIAKRIGLVCYVIEPILTVGKGLFVHISRIKKCTATLDKIKDHVGIKEPTKEQQVELYNEIDHIDGILNNDSQDELPEENQTNIILAPDIILNTDIKDQPVANSSQTSPNPIEPVPDSTSLSQSEIEKSQEMIEEKLNLEKEPIVFVKNGNSNDSLPEVNDSERESSKKKQRKKPIKERWSLVQSLSNTNNLADKHTLYFREAKQTKPHQEEEFLLTTSGTLPSDMSKALFISAKQVEQMKVKSICQSEIHDKEFIAKVKTGKNYNSFYLGQRFGHILSLFLILFLSFGVIDGTSVDQAEVKTSNIIGLKQKLYTTHGFNCHNPSSVRYIDKEQRCNSEKVDYQESEEHHWDILIHPAKRTYKGHSCSIIKSNLIVRCGLWSYNQILTVPDTEIRVHIPYSDCQAMALEGVYRTSGGKEIKLDTKKENVISLTLGGTIHATKSKTNFCQGTDLQLATGIVENAIQLEQLKINVLSTNILAETNHRLISDRDMEYLPIECDGHNEFCYGRLGTYIWNTKEFHEQCFFEHFKLAKFTRVEPHTFLDSHNKLIIRFDPDGNGKVVKCNDQIIMQSLEGLWLTTRKPDNPWIWKRLQTPNLHQTLEVSINYLIYIFTKKIADNHKDVTSNRCRLQNRIRSDSLEHLDENLFVKDLGDSLVLLECKRAVMTLKSNSEICYKDIQLDPHGFLDKENHLVKFNSSQRPCRSENPQLIIKTLDGEFLSQEPSLKNVVVNRNYSIAGNLNFFAQEYNITDYLDHDAGLLTSSEWKDLNNMIQYANVKDMLSEDLFNSLCTDNQNCISLSHNNPVQVYNSQILRIPNVQEIENHFRLNLWTKFTSFVERHVAIICVFTLFFQCSVIVFSCLDFICNNNDSNIIRIFLQLLFKFLTFLTRCICNFNLNNFRRNNTRVDEIADDIELSPIEIITSLNDLE